MLYLPDVGVCLGVQFFHDDPPISGSMGLSRLGSSNILLYNSRERWQITKEDVICSGVSIALYCYHRVLHVHLLESAPEPKKSRGTSVSSRN